MLRILYKFIENSSLRACDILYYQFEEKYCPLYFSYSSLVINTLKSTFAFGPMLKWVLRSFMVIELSLESLVTWIGIEMSKSEEVLIGALKHTYTSSSERRTCSSNHKVVRHSLERGYEPAWLFTKEGFHTIVDPRVSSFSSISETLTNIC